MVWKSFHMGTCVYSRGLLEFSWMPSWSFRCIADRPFIVKKLVKYVKYNVLDPFVCEKIQSTNDYIKWTGHIFPSNKQRLVGYLAWYTGWSTNIPNQNNAQFKGNLSTLPYLLLLVWSPQNGFLFEWFLVNPRIFCFPNSWIFIFGRRKKGTFTKNSVFHASKGLMAYGHRWKDAADEAKHHKQTMEEDEDND